MRVAAGLYRSQCMQITFEYRAEVTDGILCALIGLTDLGDEHTEQSSYDYQCEKRGQQERPEKERHQHDCSNQRHCAVDELHETIRQALNQLMPQAPLWNESLLRIITEKFMIATDGHVKVEFKNGI